MEAEASTLIRKNPLQIHISRKELFQRAAQQLSLTIKKETVLPIRKNDFSAAIEITGFQQCQPDKPDLIKFYGDFSPTAPEAIDNAYNEALKFLVKRDVIIIDDFNYNILQKTQYHLAEAETYLMFTEDSGHMLENELDFKTQGYKRLDSIIKTVCKESSPVLPLSLTKQANPQTGAEFDMVVFTGDESSADPANKIALSLVEMDQIINVHGYEIVHGDYSAMKEYWNRAANRNDE